MMTTGRQNLEDLRRLVDELERAAEEDLSCRRSGMRITPILDIVVGIYFYTKSKRRYGSPRYALSRFYGTQRAG